MANSSTSPACSAIVRDAVLTDARTADPSRSDTPVSLQSFGNEARMFAPTMSTHCRFVRRPAYADSRAPQAKFEITHLRAAGWRSSPAWRATFLAQ